MEEQRIENTKPSYEELESMVKGLIRENSALKMQAGITRMQFLFEVVRNNYTFDEEIVDKAIEEISEALFPIKEDEE